MVSRGYVRGTSDTGTCPYTASKNNDHVGTGFMLLAASAAQVTKTKGAPGDVGPGSGDLMLRRLTWQT